VSARTLEKFFKKNKKNEKKFNYPLDLLKKRCNIEIVMTLLGNKFTAIP